MLELGVGTAAVDAGGLVVGGGMRWSFGNDTGTIGMVLVAREMQGKGVGRALMTTLIDQSAPRALMLNATAEGLELYKKLGFVPVGLVRQHQGMLAEGAALPVAPKVALRRAVAADAEMLCTIDAAAFGADRSPLMRRLLSNGEAWLVERAGRPTGFAVLRAFGRGTMIGPVLAPSEEEAIALVAAAVRIAPPGLVRIDIPAHAEHLAAWLTAAGLPAIDAVTMMLRGTWPKSRKEPQRFALVLQALG